MFDWAYTIYLAPYLSSNGSIPTNLSFIWRYLSSISNQIQYCSHSYPTTFFIGPLFNLICFSSLKYWASIFLSIFSYKIQKWRAPIISDLIEMSILYRFWTLETRRPLCCFGKITCFWFSKSSSWSRNGKNSSCRASFVRRTSWMFENEKSWDWVSWADCSPQGWRQCVETKLFLENERAESPNGLPRGIEMRPSARS